ncbi:MAG: ABC transporter permease [Rufibacter sp.]
MLKNYLKIAWKVLQRRKFFTFISLFGISFTLMVLMVVTTFVNHILGDEKPASHPERMLFVNRLMQQGEGTMTTSAASYYFLNKFVKPMATPENMTFFTGPSSTNTYVKGRKLSMDLRYTDHEYWQVLDHEFIEGRPFTAGEEKNSAFVAVISKNLKQAYFGDAPVLNQDMEIDRIKYKVIGVVESVPVTRNNLSADVWVPMTTLKSWGTEDAVSNSGRFNAILLAPNASAVADMQEEFNERVSKAPVDDPKMFKTLHVHADTQLENLVRDLTSENYDVKVGAVVGVFFLVMLLFMVLPAVNLVNINISRIMERASEIGVRKAFGASSWTLVGQFLVENIFLTLLGGALGIAMAWGVIALINDSGVIPHAQFSLNLTVFMISIFTCLFFGVLSGVYPALKMSKMPAVAALKGGAQ